LRKKKAGKKKKQLKPYPKKEKKALDGFYKTAQARFHRKNLPGTGEKEGLFLSPRDWGQSGVWCGELASEYETGAGKGGMFQGGEKREKGGRDRVRGIVYFEGEQT